MIKPINVNIDKMHIDDKLLAETGFTVDDFIEQVSSGIVNVYAKGHYVAQISVYEYEIYNKASGSTVEADALDLYLNHRDELQKMYPDSRIQNIIGYVLSQRIPPQY